jgi:hypothetical protein
MYYVLFPDGRVESFGKATIAEARRAEAAAASDLTDPPGVYCVSTPAALKDVPTTLLIALYNIAASEPESHAKTITKFSDRAVAEKRTWPVIEYLAKPGTPPEKSVLTPEEEEMAKAAKKKSKKVVRANGPEGQRGRISKYAGKKLYKLVKENPRRKGTHGAKAFDLITSGMLYETYIEAGGEPKHLQWDIEHKFVEVKSA